MSELSRRWFRGALTAVVVAAVAAPAVAFFPPVIAPINRPVAVTKDPIVQPVKIPPVDPCVKPTPKPRPTPQNCGCPTTGTANTPEPATLISAGMRAMIAGAVGYVKKRRKAK